VRKALEKKRKRYKELSYRRGYSLVELLVAMAITLVVMAGVYKVFVIHQNAYLLQEQIAEMQQNARTAKYVMTREIRMAGYDPFGTAGAGFESAAADSVRFTMDIVPENGDGTIGDGTISVPGDDITYAVFEDDDGKMKLGRGDGTNNRAIVENIDAVGFAYAFDNNDDGNIDIHPDSGYVIWAFDSDGGGTLDKNLDTNDDGVIDAADSENGVDLPVSVAPTGEVALERIRAVRIWILARTENEERGYANTSTYVLANQRVPASDGRRRQLVITTVKCRNMAL
jgi:prepilin-type N-terminal cleavage/methylation domain-containing protein